MICSSLACGWGEGILIWGIGPDKSTPINLPISLNLSGLRSFKVGVILSELCFSRNFILT